MDGWKSILRYVEKGRVFVVRRCTIEYQNSTESQPRYTDIVACTFIKLFHVDDLKIIAENKNAGNLATVTNYDMNHLTGLRYMHVEGCQ